MKKIILLTTVFLMAAVSMRAQNATMRNASAADGTLGNSYFVVGQPLSFCWDSTSLSLSAGVAQAQLLTINLVVDTCQDEGYQRHGFVYGADTAPGTYFDTNYVKAVAFGYDSLFNLTLNIHPSYHVYDTLSFYHKPEAPWVVGENVISEQTAFGCDSNLHVFVYLRPFQCGDLLYDIEENAYRTDSLAGTCWMLENLRSTMYDDSSAVAGNKVYVAPLAPDADQNLATYGYLYTWEAASKRDAERDSDLVFGICPAGWHLPTFAEMNNLSTYGSDSLKSTILWLVPGNNASGFNALPAGDYNGSADRFENLLGKTFFWLSGPAMEAQAYASELRFSCETLLTAAKPKADAFSVRCVQNSAD